MRVSTLIAELSKLDPNAQVYVPDAEMGRPYGEAVEKVERDKQGDVWLLAE